MYTDETSSIAKTWAVQRQLPMENADEYCHSVRNILAKQCPSIQEWYNDQTDDQSIDVIDDPSQDQAAFLDYVEEELLERIHADGVDIKLAYISEDMSDGQTHATYSPDDEIVYLNAFADDWDAPTPKRIGTILHELGHHETDVTDAGHGPDWYHTVEELSGAVI